MFVCEDGQRSVPLLQCNVGLKLLVAGQVLVAPSFWHCTDCFPHAGHRVKWSQNTESKVLDPLS
jgi:hypothetical protein